MKVLISTFILFLLFQGCSSKSPDNKWEYNSANAFASFSKNFLTDNQEIAQDDLERSIKYAKQSANLEQLSRIYLGECALNISIGIKDKCNKYFEIEELVESSELKAYFLMLQNSLEKKQIKRLPSQYQYFSQYKYEKKYDLSFNAIKNMEQSSSKFVAASLIKEHISKSQIEYLIEKSSFYGYKKIVLFWLNHLRKIEDNKDEKKKIIKKIMILETN